MIIEQNIPANVRTWALCQVKIRQAEHLCQQYSCGKCTSWSNFSSLKVLGRERYLKEVCEPEIARLQRRMQRYRKIAAEQMKEMKRSPESWLLSKHEVLSMLGMTLHYREQKKEIYETLQYCSDNGEYLFSAIHAHAGIANPYDGLDSLSLLSLGFGRNK